MDSHNRTITLSALTSLVVSTMVLLVGARAIDREAISPRNIDTHTLAERDASVVDVVEKADAAVVSVIITKDLPVIQRYYETVPFDESPFGVRIPRYRQLGTEEREVGGGTAFFVDEDGLLMTNKHVVNDETADYTVLLNDGRRLPAEVVARDATNDIALLRVEGSGFSALELEESDELHLGQSVIAIGNALAEFRNTVSVGVISGLQRTITAGSEQEGTVEQLSRIIQTDAAINQGNSGGPLLNLEGNVVGMNTAIALTAQNISFAIPVSDLRRDLESFDRLGRIARPFLGVRYVQITPQLAAQNDLPYDYGILVAHGEGSDDVAVVSGSPADEAGIRDGDIILEADGIKLDGQTLLGDIIQGFQPGESIELTVATNRRERTVTVTLDEWQQ